VGPADLAALVATAAFALALPPNAAGFFLLRLVEDIKNARLEDVALEAFQEAGLSVNQVQPSDTSESIAKQRTKTVLINSYSISSKARQDSSANCTSNPKLERRRELRLSCM
jgi:hypothetical protein